MKTIFDLDGRPLHIKNIDAIQEKYFDEECLEKANLRGLVLEGASFCDAFMDGADLSGADCYGASFYRARLKGGILKMGIFKGADFRLADLREADLRGADFEGVKLNETDFCHADLTGALYGNAKFLGAAYDKGTIFPDGFDPAGAGMKYIEG